MIKDISQAWRDTLMGNSGVRVYFDPRQEQYPAIAGDPGFVPVPKYVLVTETPDFIITDKGDYIGV